MVTNSTLFRRLCRGVVLAVPAVMGLLGQAFAQCPTPTISVTAGSTTLCGGGTVTLRASTSVAYLWSNGATTQSITTGAPGVYTVQTYIAGTCTSAASAGTTVTVNNPFNYALPGSMAQITNGIFISPANPTTDDEVTITVYPNATMPSGSGGLTGASQVRIHGGVQFTAGGATFQNGIFSPDVRCNFTLQSNGTWTKTFVPRTFYGVAAGVSINALTFVLNGGPTNNEWSKVGKLGTDGNSDIIFQMNIVPNLASSNSPITSGQTLNLTGATISNGTYAWTGPNSFSSSSRTPSITNAQGIASGSYYLTVTSGLCVKRDTVEVLVGCTTPATPTISSSTGSLNMCSDGYITLTSSNATGTNYWSNGAVGRSITVSNTGSYSVYNILNGCQSATSDTARVSLNSALVTSNTSTGSRSIATGVTMYPANPTANDLVTIVVDPSVTCSRGAGSLSTSTQVRWHGGVKIGRNGGNFTNTVSADGNNTKAFFTRNNDGTWSKSFVPRTFFSLNATDSIFALTFVLNGGTSGSPWDLQGKACDGNGDIIATIDPTIPQVASSNTPVVPTTTLNLYGRTAAGASFSWTGPNGFTSSVQNPVITNAPESASGTYSLTITSGACTTSKSVSVLVGCDIPATPVVSASGSLQFCSTGSVTLTSTVGYNYLWSNGATTRSINVNQTGTYSVITYQGTCTSATSNVMTVTVIDALDVPVITASRSLALCAGDYVTLTSSYATGNVWSNGATTQSIMVSNAGTFNVYAISSGCTSAVSTSSVVNVNNAFSANTTGSTTVGSGISVSPANATADDFVTITLNAKYSCPSNSLLNSTQVRMHGGVKIGRNGNGFQYVVGADGGNAKSYFTRVNDSIWTKSFVPRTYFGLAPTDSIFQINFVMNGGLNNSPWDLQGKTCPGEGDFNVNLNTNTGGSSVSVNGPIQPGGTLNFTAATVAGATYSWTGPSGFTSNVQNAVKTNASVFFSGLYTVVTTVGSCSKTDTVRASVGCNLATPTITANGPTTYCSGNTVVLTSTLSTGYLWSNGATTRSITVTASGSYRVRTINGVCTSAYSNAIATTVNALPTTPVITASGPTTFVTGGSVVLTAPASTFYVWSNNASTQNITVSTAGTYSVRVVNVLGCTSATSTSVTVTTTSAGNATIWDGTSWSNGEPTSGTKDVFINSNMTNTSMDLVAGTLTLAGGNLSVASATVTGRVNTGSNVILGACKLTGNSNQQVSGNFEEINLMNSSGATVVGATNVSILKLTSGTFNAGSNNWLTIKGVSARGSSLQGVYDGTVGAVSFGGTITGSYNFNVQPQAGGGLTARQVSSPVTGAVRSNLAGVTSQQDYSESANAWSFWTTVQGATLPVGKSILAAATNADGITFRGTHTSGSVSIPLARTNAISTGSVQYGFNAIGNPYACPIDWVAVNNISGNSAVTNGTAWIWRSGQYITVTKTGVSSSAAANSILAAGQGFLLRRSTVGGTANLSFTSNVRVSTSPTSLVRSAALPQSIRLQLSSNATSINDEALIYGADDATVGMDDLDAEKVISPLAEAPSLYIVNEQNLSTSAMPMLNNNETRVVALEVIAPAAGKYTLTATEMGNFPAGTKVMIEDKKSGVFTEFTDTYSFNANAGDVKRMNLYFTSTTSGAAAFANVYTTGKTVNVAFNSVEAANATVVVYDAAGRVITSTSANGNMNLSLPISAANGVYMVKVSGAAGNSTSKIYIGQ